MENKTEREKRVKKSIIDQDPINVGKVPPHATELEQAVLGALMIDRNAFNTVVEILKPDSFYEPRNKLIYEAAMQLYEKGEPIDIIRITNQLRSIKKLEAAGGAFYITNLTNRITSAANIEFHARIVAEKHIQRELIVVGTEMIQTAYDESTDALQLMDDVQRKIFEVSEKNIKNKTQNITDVIKKAITKLENIKQNEGTITGVPTGLQRLDEITSGFQNSNLIIIAARPGMGKTALALTIARNASVTFKKNVAFFSLEMSGVELVTRLMSAEAEIDSRTIQSGNLTDQDWQRLNDKITALSDSGLFIDDTPGLTVFELKSKCRKLKAQNNLDMVMVDYLQLMKGDDKKNAGIREQEISYISRSLKELAKELEIPVIALAQLSRDVEKLSTTKRPMLSHLRESGSIEQDADLVMFIYRPEKYAIEQFEDGQPTQGLADIMLEKNRHGQTDSNIRVRFVGEYTKFTNADSYDFGGGFGITESFNNGPTSYNKSSKMNDDEDFNFSPF